MKIKDCKCGQASLDLVKIIFFLSLSLSLFIRIHSTFCKQQFHKLTTTMLDQEIKIKPIAGVKLNLQARKEIK